MALHKEWQYTITCDICGRWDCSPYGTQAKFAERMLKEGWRVFGNKKAFCPECARRREKEKRKGRE